MSALLDITMLGNFQLKLPFILQSDTSTLIYLCINVGFQPSDIESILHGAIYLGYDQYEAF